MSMRSDDERDQDIDLLIAKVKFLEEEVTRLGDLMPDRKSTPVRQNEGYKSSQGIFIPDPSSTRQTPKTSDQGIFIPDSQPAKQVPKPSNVSLENAIGTRWIGRIGVVAILLGVAFFLKYSFDNKLIGEAGRIILGLIWGTAFIGTGEYLQKKKNLKLYGQMLTAGGLAVLYLSLYAAFALYHLIPIFLAAAGMLVVTTAGMTLSVRYSAYALAAIALLGGFLTPLMLSTGQNQPYTLFGYILLLDAGTLILLRFRPWMSLAVASLCGTILIYVGWHGEFYTDAQRWLAFGVVLTFFVFYNLSVIIFRLRSDEDATLFDHLVIFGSAAFFFLAFLAQSRFALVWEVKICALVLAVVEIALALMIRQSASAARKAMVSYAVASVIMTVIATFMILEQRWLMPALAAEMAALGWVGLRLDVPILRRGAYLIGLLVLVRFTQDIFIRFEPFQSFTPVLNGRFLICATAIAAFYVLFYGLWRFKDRISDEERHAPEMVFTLTQVLSLALLSVEVHDYFRFQSPGYILRWTDGHYAYQLALSVLWALYASIVIGIGMIKRIRGARILGILFLGITVFKVFMLDLSELRTFYRIISFIVLGLLLLIIAYFYNRFKHAIFGEDEP